MPIARKETQIPRFVFLTRSVYVLHSTTFFSAAVVVVAQPIKSMFCACACVCVCSPPWLLHLAEQVPQINIDIKHSEAFIILALSATKAVAEA